MSAWSPSRASISSRAGALMSRRTGEIGRAAVTGIEKKGKINRRVRIALGAA